VRHEDGEDEMNLNMGDGEAIVNDSTRMRGVEERDP
jgi:hypothetical protein